MSLLKIFLTICRIQTCLILSQKLGHHRLQQTHVLSTSNRQTVQGEVFYHFRHWSEWLAELSQYETTICVVLLNFHMHKSFGTPVKSNFWARLDVVFTCTYLRDNEKSFFDDSLFLTRKLPSFRSFKTVSASIRVIEPWNQLLKAQISTYY